eukprot:11683314-Prorocentrum_lima.AAC.1
MTSSLVGSEMCIRDSMEREQTTETVETQEARQHMQDHMAHQHPTPTEVPCLLYTSDAADDM